MLNFGQKLPISTLSKQQKFQNNRIGRLGAKNIQFFKIGLSLIIDGRICQFLKV